MVTKIVIVMIRRGRESRKPQEKQAIHNKTVHHPLTKNQPIPKEQSAPPGQFFPVYVLGMSFSMEYLFGQFRSAVLAVLCQVFLCTSSLAEHETLKNPWVKGLSNSQNIVRISALVSVIPSNHSTVAATKNINCVPDRTSTKCCMKICKKQLSSSACEIQTLFLIRYLLKTCVVSREVFITLSEKRYHSSDMYPKPLCQVIPLLSQLLRYPLNKNA